MRIYSAAVSYTHLVDGVELSVEEYGIGFRKGSDLCEEVNKILADLYEEGTLPDLAEKYGLSLAPALTGAEA